MRSGLLVLLTVLSACPASAGTMKCGKIGGVEAKTRLFPRQIKSRSLDYARAKARFAKPKDLSVVVGKAALVGSKVTLAALVRNRSDKPFALVVNPYGGSFPYGGDSPFALKLSAAAAKIVKYSGKLYPPEPPKPMLIELPAAGCVQFDAQIELSNYSYKGSPKVKLDWALYYFGSSYPKGSVEIQLPNRK